MKYCLSRNVRNKSHYFIQRRDETRRGERERERGYSNGNEGARKREIECDIIINYSNPIQANTEEIERREPEMSLECRSPDHAYSPRKRAGEYRCQGARRYGKVVRCRIWAEAMFK